MKTRLFKVALAGVVALNVLLPVSALAQSGNILYDTLGRIISPYTNTYTNTYSNGYYGYPNTNNYNYPNNYYGYPFQSNVYNTPYNNNYYPQNYNPYYSRYSNYYGNYYGNAKLSFDSNDIMRLRQLRWEHPDWFANTANNNSHFPFSSAVYGYYNQIYKGQTLPNGIFNHITLLPTSVNSRLGLSTNANVRVGVVGNSVVLVNSSNHYVYDVAMNVL